MLNRLLAAASVLALCASEPSVASHTHPTDPNAVLLDSITVAVELRWDLSDSTSDFDLGASKGDGSVEHTVLVWATSEGTDLVGGAMTATLTGSSSGIPPSRDLFVAASNAAIDSAVCRNIIPSTQSAVDLYQPEQVDASSSGATVTWTSCSSGAFVRRAYTINGRNPVAYTLTSEDACSGPSIPGCSCIGRP